MTKAFKPKYNSKYNKLDNETAYFSNGRLKFIGEGSKSFEPQIIPSSKIKTLRVSYASRLNRENLRTYND